MLSETNPGFEGIIPCVDHKKLQDRLTYPTYQEQLSIEGSIIYIPVLTLTSGETEPPPLPEMIEGEALSLLRPYVDSGETEPPPLPEMRC